MWNLAHSDDCHYHLFIMARHGMVPRKRQAEAWQLLAGAPYGIEKYAGSKNNMRLCVIISNKRRSTNTPRLHGTDAKKCISLLHFRSVGLFLARRRLTSCACRSPKGWGSDGLVVVGELCLLPVNFSVGSIEINGKTLLKLLQFNLPWGFDFKAL